jgi:hypothetical protein
MEVMGRRVIRVLALVFLPSHPQTKRDEGEVQQPKKINRP